MRVQPQAERITGSVSTSAIELLADHSPRTTEGTIRTDCWKWDTRLFNSPRWPLADPIASLLFYIAITMLSGAIEPAISIRRRD